MLLILREIDARTIFEQLYAFLLHITLINFSVVNQIFSLAIMMFPHMENCIGAQIAGEHMLAESTLEQWIFGVSEKGCSSTEALFSEKYLDEPLFLLKFSNPIY